MTCIYCESDFSEHVFIETNPNNNHREYLPLCPDCKKQLNRFIESGEGKIEIVRCKECGHIRRIELIKYKLRGRPEGSKNDPVKIAAKKGIAKLETF